MRGTDSTESSIGTKVYADDQLRVLWNADDRISLFNQYTFNQEYRFDGETGANAGTFSKVSTEVVATGNELPVVYAVYPYSSLNSVSNDGVLSIAIPSEQQYAEGTFAPGMNIMVSATRDQYLKFKNVCGILAVKLYGSGLSVSSIELKGNDDESIAGNAAVTINPGEEISTPSRSTTACWRTVQRVTGISLPVMRKNKTVRRGGGKSARMDMKVVPQ